MNNIATTATKNNKLHKQQCHVGTVCWSTSVIMQFSRVKIHHCARRSSSTVTKAEVYLFWIRSCVCGLEISHAILACKRHHAARLNKQLLPGREPSHTRIQKLQSGPATWRCSTPGGARKTESQAKLCAESHSTTACVTQVFSNMRPGRSPRCSQSHWPNPQSANTSQSQIATAVAQTTAYFVPDPAGSESQWPGVSTAPGHPEWQPKRERALPPNDDNATVQTHIRHLNVFHRVALCTSLDSAEIYGEFGAQREGASIQNRSLLEPLVLVHNTRIFCISRNQ